ncbi:MAG: hypothetical protein SV765_16420 [Pseudomonadota bacterium]|nr:hypothetical protein [Pseudomonadota bacterium]
MTRTLLLLLLLIINSPAYPQPTAEVYETYLPAEKLVPLLRPFLGPEEKITGFRNKLFVKAEPATQEEVLRILQNIDRPLHNIEIALRYAEFNQDQDRNTGAEGSIKIFRGSSRSSEIQVDVVDRRRFSTRDENVTQRIRVLEGQQAALELGRDVPQQQLVLLSPWQAGVQTEYRTVGNRLYVVPQLVKDQIRVEVYTRQQQPQPDPSDTSDKTEAQSVLLLEPDIWTPLAAVTNGRDQASTDHGVVSRTRSTRQRQSDKTLQIRARILD